MQYPHKAGISKSGSCWNRGYIGFRILDLRNLKQVSTLFGCTEKLKHAAQVGNTYRRMSADEAEARSEQGHYGASDALLGCTAPKATWSVKKGQKSGKGVCCRFCWLWVVGSGNSLLSTVSLQRHLRHFSGSLGVCW